MSKVIKEYQKVFSNPYFGLSTSIVFDLIAIVSLITHQEIIGSFTKTSQGLIGAILGILILYTFMSSVIYYYYISQIDDKKKYLRDLEEIENKFEILHSELEKQRKETVRKYEEIKRNIEAAETEQQEEKALLENYIKQLNHEQILLQKIKFEQIKKLIGSEKTGDYSFQGNENLN